ncbi:hypothetical protein LTR08_007287 [Meristemomyces frigidus]|nr:hypothetical protein LTR08_007287 [Meristemomyces frigidus]
MFTALSLARKVVQARKPKNNTVGESTPRGSRSFRLLAILPVLIMGIAVILSILCVYAGHTPGMMDDYAIFTLNTSRIGQNLCEELDTKISSVHFKRAEPLMVPTITAVPTTMITMAPRGIASDVTSLAGHASSAIHSAESVVHSKATSVESAAASRATSALGAVQTNVIKAVNKAYNGLIADLELKDFYAVHMMATCSGEYRYHNGTNVTVGSSPPSSNNTHEHVDSCSKHSDIDPMSLVRIIYWIGIVHIVVAFVLGVTGILVTSRKMALINIFGTLPAFCFLGLASAITHGISVGGARFISFVGADVGIAGYTGYKFLALTWTTTVLLLINLCLWTLLFFLSGRTGQAPKPKVGSKTFWDRRNGRPDRTSGIAMMPISHPMPIYDSHGHTMI